ncbi:hypothetical protein [Sulfitobacter sp. MF3-043]|uniref:hypothetical protein n=1 Tax=Sulfitobacter sediminivivens TaxID=3252902 RepID=UPI0036DE00BF
MTNYPTPDKRETLGLNYPTDSEILSLLRHRLRIDFGDGLDEFFSLCMNERNFPLGSKHPEYLDRLFVVSITKTQFDHFLVAYIYLAAATFAMDRICDGQSDSISDCLGIPELLIKGKTHLSDAFGTAENLPQDFNADFAISALFSEFRNAMKTEERLRATKLIHSESAEFENLTDRSVLFVEAYKWLSLLRGNMPEEQDVDLLRVFVFYMQRGDDLGDWREDYLIGNATYFLRRCFEHIGSECSEAELESFVYFSGAYEQEAKLIIGGLLEIQEQLVRRPQSAHLSAFVDRQRMRAVKVLSNFERAKAGGSSRTSDMGGALH